ncbi:MAG: hypothetical protein ACFFET_12810 [Candidatus Thorarchaeota archaeon]
MRFQSRIDWNSRRVRGGIAATTVILLLLPAIWCSFFYRLYPQAPAMGRANVEILADTFVSTEDDTDHSSEAIIRISNASDGENETLEIAFFEFELYPPPATSYLADLVFEFDCSEVPMGGILRFHKCESVTLESNVTFHSRPEYNPVPFTNVTITQNGTYTVSLHEEGGYTDWSVQFGLFAIVADGDAQIIIHSSDAEPRFQPQMELFSPLGLWINPAENPQLCYAHPLAWVSVSAAIVLLSIGCVKSSKLGSGAEGEI